MTEESPNPEPSSENSDQDTPAPSPSRPLTEQEEAVRHKGVGRMFEMMDRLKRQKPKEQD